MPRNSSGTYSLPAGNPVVSNTLIQTTWANPTMSDLGTGITDSLDRQGRGAMLAPLKNIDGSATGPAMTFSSEGTLGIYRVSAGVLGIAAGGALVLSISASGLVFTEPVVIPLGTAAAPSLTFTGNTNTGIYSPGTSQVSITTAGVDRLAVNSSGVVTLSDGAIVLGSTTANFITASNAAANLQFQTNGSTRLTIDAAGNLTPAVAILMPNAVPLQWKDTGGTARTILQLNGSTVSIGDVFDAIPSSAVIIRADGTIYSEIGGTNIATMTASGVGVFTTPIAGVGITVLSGEPFRAVGSAPFLSGWNAGLTQRTGYLQFSAASTVTLAAENGAALDFIVSGGNALHISTTQNLGFGVTPSAWSNSGNLQLSSAAVGICFSGGGAILSNAYFNSGYKYVGTGPALRYDQNSGAEQHSWWNAPSGTAGAAITFTQAMTLDSAGNLMVATTTANGKLSVAGSIVASDATVAFLSVLSASSGNSVLTAFSATNQGWLIQTTAGGTTSTRITITAAGVTSFTNLVTIATSEALRIENDGGFISFFNTANTLRSGYIQFSAAAPAVISVDVAQGLQFNTNSISRLTISSGGVIADAVAELGWKDIPQNNQTAAYTLVIGDRGKSVTITTGGVTVPASIFAAGNVVTITNNSATSQTITQGAGVTMHQAGTATTGNRTLLPWGIATLECIGSSVFIIAGNVS